MIKNKINTHLVVTWILIVSWLVEYIVGSILFSDIYYSFTIIFYVAPILALIFSLLAFFKHKNESSTITLIIVCTSIFYIALNYLLNQ